MKVLVLMLLKLGLTQAPATHANTVHPDWIGECYVMFNCQGSPLGTLSDDQCRNMGGHSMKINGSVCISI